MFDAQLRITDDWSVVQPYMSRWHAESPAGGVLVLLPEAEKHRVPALQAAAAHAQTPLIGAIFPALVDAAGFAVQGAWLLHWRTMPPYRLVEQGGQDYAAGAEAIRAAIEPTLKAYDPAAGPPTLLLMFDAMLPDIGSILIDLYSSLRRSVQYAGVNAGSETFAAMPCLFDETRLIDKAVLAIVLPPSARVASRHGYPVSKALLSATSTQGNRVDCIDGEPAFAVYQRIVADEYGVALTPGNFYEHAVHFPLGLVTAADVLVRIPVAMGDDGSITCVGEVPTYARVRLMRAPALHDSDCVRELAAAMRSERERPLLLFYCAGRRMHFGGDAYHEVAEFMAESRATQLFGALSLGEIDTIPELGLPRFHNAALLCVAAG